jgi:hypothetical protein
VTVNAALVIVSVMVSFASAVVAQADVERVSARQVDGPVEADCCVREARAEPGWRTVGDRPQLMPVELMPARLLKMSN